MWIRAYTSETLYNQSVLIKITTVPDLIIRDPDNAYILIAVAVLSFAAVLILAFGCLILGEFAIIPKNEEKKSL